MSAFRLDDVWWDRHGTASLLEAALDAIGRAAIVVDASGDVLQANGIARALLADREGSIRETLRAVVRAGGAEHPDWSVTPVVTNGHGVEHLVVARPVTGGIAGRLAQAEREWGLTRRQREVLAKVAKGNANKIIAGALGVSVRTVEVHLTAVFMKAHVASRAELLVKLSAIE
jgi:DNA-binding CsgD family transcriptional regulator